MKSVRYAISSTLLITAFATSAHADTRLLRDPAISESNIAFVYAGDIWLADQDGQQPRRLTTHTADETGPVFSPDGSRIAYTAEYEGNADVFSISINGGQPTRHTWHPGDDTAIDWSSDGEAIAFTSRRETLAGRAAQLYHVALTGGLPEKQMEARIFRGRYNDSGQQIAMIPFGPAYNALYGGSSGWRGYRGGTTPTIQILDTRRDRWSEIPGERVNDIEPMWIGDNIYFLSDREDETFNLYRYEQSGDSVSKVSNETVWDIRAADAHGETIVFEAGGELKLFDTANGAVTELTITLDPDLPQLQSSWKAVAGQTTSMDLSNSGKRVAVTARGEVFSVPVKDGSTRNLSDSSGVREYTATWSPDGTRIAYIVETDRRQVLRIENQSGIETPREIDLGDAFYSLLDWGGDGGHIIYQDNHLNVFALNIEAGTSELIGSDARRQFGQPTVDVDTSPDGRWVALALEQANFNRTLHLYDLQESRLTRVTNGLADIGAPAFSQDGTLLYFTASTNSGPTQVGLDMTTQERPYRAAIYVAVLEANGLSPLLPKPGDENAAADEEEAEEESESDVIIALDGLESRITALPVAEAAYSDLAAGEDGHLYFVRTVQPGSSNPLPATQLQADAELMRFNTETLAPETLMSGAVALQISDDGSHLLVAKSDGSAHVGKVAATIEVKPLNMSGLKMRIDPRAEWAQIFDDVWRMEAEYFYDPNLHQLDWQAVYERYSPLLEHVGRREDLNTLMAEMIAEMRAGHNRLGGGDIIRTQSAGTGLLGADIQIENNRHRIGRIYTGETWNPFLSAPLSAPGLDVSEGDYIIAVNGQELTDEDNIYQALADTADNQTRLTLSTRANGRNPRTVTVIPTNNENALRLWAWVEGNRKAVDEATDGRVGYVYLPNTAGAGFTFFNRMFFAQTDKDALIIDERSNGGGQAANYITDVLSRDYLAGWKDRDGAVFNTPGGAMFGPKLMLIDQDAGSGGDFLPYSFRQLGIGKLVGKRTWGGLIGISVNPGLVDGGFLTVPYFRYFDADFEWTIENQGVAPDIDVALDPIAANNGRDTQLEAAIAEILRDLETNPSRIPTEAPPYPTEPGQ